MQTKFGEKEFLKSYNVLLRCHLTSTGHPVHPAGFNGVVQLSPQKDNVRIQKFFLTNFVLIHRAKYIFFRDMFCLQHSQNSRCMYACLILDLVTTHQIKGSLVWDQPIIYKDETLTHFYNFPKNGRQPWATFWSKWEIMNPLQNLKHKLCSGQFF